jgi:hypothetical protein
VVRDIALVRPDADWQVVSQHKLGFFVHFWMRGVTDHSAALAMGSSTTRFGSKSTRRSANALATKKKASSLN